MDQPRPELRKYEQVGVPQIAGRTYQNTKTYLGLTMLPALGFGTTIQPTFDLSHNVDTSKELKFNTLTFTLAQIPGGVGWNTNSAYALVVPCPEGVEHLYLNLAMRFNTASANNTSKYNIYVSSEAAISTQPNAFLPSTDPSFIPTLIQVASQDTTIAEYVLSKTVLPLYVPPKGFLVIFPKDVSVDPDTASALSVCYERIERTAGVGPLVY